MTQTNAVISKTKQETPYKMNRKIGSTNYVVLLNFSKTSRENMNDKIVRLIKSEAQNRT